MTAYLVKKHNLITDTESICGVAYEEDLAQKHVKVLRNEKANDGRHFYYAWYEELEVLE